MERRNFLRGIAAASVLPAFSFKAANFGELEKVQLPKSNIKPKKLQPGNTVGLIAPGSFIDEDELEESVTKLEELGLKVKFTGNILAKYGYLGGKDPQRAEDVNWMFSNDEIDGIVCARGGYGCSRILPALNYDMIKNNPKILVGYSDITALLYGIFAKTGLVCFHGPVSISTFNDFSVKYFKDVLMEPKDEILLESAEENIEEAGAEFERYTINEGTAEGELVGGNFSIAVSMLATPYDVSYDNKILFLEEIKEKPYRIDRFFTQMLLAGKFDNVKGIALGVFKDCEEEMDDADFENSFTLKQVFEDRLGNLGIPIAYGLSFGHIKNKFTIPFGVKAKLDADNQTLKLLESAVI